jgi:hypothetical protein
VAITLLMSHFRIGMALLFALLIGKAAAEPESSGTWRATYSTQAGERHRATVIIHVAEGIWITPGQSNSRKHEPCAGPKFPVSLVGGGSSTVTLLIAASKVNAKCPDRSARLTVVDTNTLEGEFSDGNVLRLDRVAN